MLNQCDLSKKREANTKHYTLVATSQNEIKNTRKMPHFWLMDELSSCPQKYDHLIPFSEEKAPHDESAEFSPQKLPKRQVRFDSNPPVIRSVQGRKKMTTEERRSKWYTKSEFGCICKNSKEILRLAASSRRCFSSDGYNSSSNSIHEELLCIRGLEHRLKKNKIRRRTIKTNAINAVLSEQDRQRYNIIAVANFDNAKGCCSKLEYAKEIRKIYREYNQSCVTDAIQQGLMDQREVRNQCDLPKRRRAVILGGGLLDTHDIEEISAREEEVNEEEELSLEDLASKASLQNSSQLTGFGDEDLDDFHDSVFHLGSDEFQLQSPQPCGTYVKTSW
jgi:hypothetical protein